MNANDIQHHLSICRSIGPRTAIAFLLLAALGCGSGQDPAQRDRGTVATEDGDIVVAVAWPWEARKELRFSEGLEMALEEINGGGGIGGRQLSLLKVDDQESVNEGRLVAQRLADNPEVMAVIGHLQSHVTVPAAAIYDRAGLLLISPASTSADLTAQGYSRVFRATFVDGDIGEQMADYALNQGYKRVAIYYVRSIYGQALASAFEERVANIGGLSVVGRDSYGTDQDVSSGALQPLLSRWRQLDIDALFLAGEVPSAGQIIAELRNSDLNVPVFGGDAMGSPALFQLGGEAVEGTVVSSFFHPGEPRPEVESFVAAFQSRYDASPDPAAALGYDALRLLAEGMRKAPTPSPEHVTQALREIDGWPGVTGPFTFDEKGDLIERKAPKMIVREGAFAYLSETEGAGNS